MDSCKISDPALFSFFHRWGSNHWALTLSLHFQVVSNLCCHEKISEFHLSDYAVYDLHATANDIVNNMDTLGKLIYLHNIQF